MTPDPAFELSKPLFEPGAEVLIKTLGPWRQPLKPLWEGHYQIILPSSTAVKAPVIDSWMHSGPSDVILCLYSLRFYFLTFEIGLIIYKGLLLLTPKFLSLLFDSQDNIFLSWTHSYATFHSQSNSWVCGALPSSSVEGFAWWVSPLQGKDFSKSATTITNKNHTETSS